jgi:hypothetical protein
MSGTLGGHGLLGGAYDPETGYRQQNPQLLMAQQLMKLEEPKVNASQSSFWANLLNQGLRGGLAGYLTDKVSTDQTAARDRQKTEADQAMGDLDRIMRGGGAAAPQPDAAPATPDQGFDTPAATMPGTSGAGGAPAPAAAPAAQNQPADNPDLVQVASPSGVKVTVASDAADAYKGFLSELEGAGYKLDQSQTGGYNKRNIAGTNTPSQHSFGHAVDINWRANPRGANGPSDLPPNIGDIAAKYGLTWGGTWAGGTRDPMHFEYGRGQQRAATAPAPPASPFDAAGGGEPPGPVAQAPAPSPFDAGMPQLGPDASGGVQVASNAPDAPALGAPAPPSPAVGGDVAAIQAGMQQARTGAPAGTQVADAGASPFAGAGIELPPTRGQAMAAPLALLPGAPGQSAPTGAALAGRLLQPGQIDGLYRLSDQWAGSTNPLLRARAAGLRAQAERAEAQLNAHSNRQDTLQARKEAAGEAAANRAMQRHYEEQRIAIEQERLKLQQQQNESGRLQPGWTWADASHTTQTPIRTPEGGTVLEAKANTEQDLKLLDKGRWFVPGSNRLEIGPGAS